MVIFPVGFTPYHFSGYYWHAYEKHLYSCKSGVLKKLKLQKPSKWNHHRFGYSISNHGKKIFVEQKYLEKHYNAIIDYTFPTYKTQPDLFNK